MSARGHPVLGSWIPLGAGGAALPGRFQPLGLRPSPLSLTERILSLSWHPSGTKIAAGSIDCFYIFDIESGKFS